jgi:serine/threonine-protein kinase RsbW
MDWLFKAGGGSNGAAGARVVAEHVRRRCTDRALAEQAGLLVQSSVASVAAGPGTVWARLDWEHAQPVLTLRHVPRDLQPSGAALTSDGVWPVDEDAGRLEHLFAAGPALELELPVGRSPELEVALPPVSSPTGMRGDGLMGNVAAVLLGQGEAGATMVEAAAAAGAGASGAALSAYVRAHGASPSSPAEVAQAFTEFYNAAGADFFVTSAGPGRAVLSNRTCPFGPAAAGHSSLCRVTASLLGALAARVNGSADVVLDETLAGGDARCRTIVDFRQSGSRWAQAYTWPPGQTQTTKALALTRGFRIALSLQLPRDRLSVSVLRHLVTDVLAEVGVLDEDRGDVEVAVTEAATNVIEHSGAGDAYEVNVTIGPALAELRVVDVGRGFDHVLLSDNVAGPQDERGRGLTLMHALVDQVRLISEPERGTIVHLVKRLRFDDSAPGRRLMRAALAAEAPGAVDAPVALRPAGGTRTGGGGQCLRGGENHVTGSPTSMDRGS